MEDRDGQPVVGVDCDGLMVRPTAGREFPDGDLEKPGAEILISAFRGDECSLVPCWHC